jgi:hypothetical protein
MAMMDQTPVMDIAPWPEGRRLAGTSTWWEYMMGEEEKQRLDNLMGTALLDEEVRDQLVSERDTSLLTAFGLSKETQAWLCEIEASSLVELAQAIVSKPQSEAYVGV